MSRAILLEPLSNMQDSSSLSKHENVVTMFRGFGHNSAPSVFKTEDFGDCIRKWLVANKYDPKHDSFVIAGRMTKIAVALAVIISEYQRVRVLIFDGVAGEYVERTL